MRIETLLEAKAEADDVHDKAMLVAIKEVRADVKALRKDLDTGAADLAALKNKGAGILIGVGLVGGTIGAAIQALISWVK